MTLVNDTLIRSVGQFSADKSKIITPTDFEFIKYADGGAEKSFDNPRAGYEQYLTAVSKSLESMGKELNSLRKGSASSMTPCIDISLGQYVQDKYQFAMSESGGFDSFLLSLGYNGSVNTIQSFESMGDFNTDFRWLIPELFREAIRLGMRRAPIYPNLISAEEFIAQPQIKMPYVKMSDAMPTYIGEGESAPLGHVAFGQKMVSTKKLGIGIQITDEVQRYVNLNVLQYFLQDVGVKVNMALDNEAINVLTNGEVGNNNAAAVIGVKDVVAGFQYEDFLRAWVSQATLGRTPQSMLSNVEPAMKVLQLPEFTNALMLLAGIDGKMVNVRTPIPTRSSYDIHGAMPAADQVMIIDNTASLIKFNSQALTVESDRIADKGVTGTYARMETGFAKVMVDASFILDQSVSIDDYGYPDWMNPFAYQAAQTFRTRP